MSRITVKFYNTDSETAELWREQEGITVKEFLEEAGVNPKKVTVFVNGEVTVDLDRELEDMDILRIETRNYSSGNGL